MPLIPNNPNPPRKPDPQKPEKPTASFEISAPKYTMSDLILSDSVLDEIRTIVKSKECWDKVFVQWQLGTVMKQKKGLFVNLYGDPGTGKTLTAHAIADALQQKLICVNYSDIESKYVGETSKNLTALFQFGKEQNAIIFFDEADALLSKRVTNMSSSTDVSVNQTRSVLLTLLNDYEGMVIFATNFISNYDPAFMRRIQYHVKFELPNAQLRQRLWRMYLPAAMPAALDIAEISGKYAGVSGSDISNAVLKSALKAAMRGDNQIPQAYFEESIQKIIDSKSANRKPDTSDMRITKTETVPESEVPEDIRRKANEMNQT